MNSKVKDILKSTVISIGMALAIFSLVGIVFDVGYGGNFSLDHYRFTKMIIGCIILGIGFGVPTVVYSSERLPMPIKVLIHMGIGLTVYTIVAYAVGWIGGAASLGQGLVIAAIQIAVAFIIWFGFMRHYRAEVRKMNEVIQAMKE
ncbi:MAG: DUF3021 domain-containing protein [Firmicutes bacterium]|nr:DUF3021 domain-containing protein [Bacillota bacterium]